MKLVIPTSELLISIDKTGEVGDCVIGTIEIKIDNVHMKCTNMMMTSEIFDHNSIRLSARLESSEYDNIIVKVESTMRGRGDYDFFVENSAHINIAIQMENYSTNISRHIMLDMKHRILEYFQALNDEKCLEFKKSIYTYSDSDSDSDLKCYPLYNCNSDSESD